jgi:excisionase family DNA binding protein
VQKIAMSMKEVCEALGLDRSTVRNLIETGRLPAVRVGRPGGRGKFIVSRQAVEDLLTGSRS